MFKVMTIIAAPTGLKELILLCEKHGISPQGFFALCEVWIPTDKLRRAMGQDTPFGKDLLLAMTKASGDAMAEVLRASVQSQLESVVSQIKAPMVATPMQSHGTVNMGHVPMLEKTMPQNPAPLQSPSSMTTEELLAKIDEREFECEGGFLHSCAEWGELKRRLYSQMETATPSGGEALVSAMKEGSFIYNADNLQKIAQETQNTTQNTIGGGNGEER